MMTEPQKQARTGRSGDKAKKIVSLTIDPTLVSQIDVYAADKKISRSAAIEAAITGLLALNSNTVIAATENSLVQPDDCIFASPQLERAIFF
jgi:hypothetical protein